MSATSKKTPLHAKRYIKPNETSLRGKPMAANGGYHERILDRVPLAPSSGGGCIIPIREIER